MTAGDIQNCAAIGDDDDNVNVTVEDAQDYAAEDNVSVNDGDIQDFTVIVEDGFL